MKAVSVLLRVSLLACLHLVFFTSFLSAATFTAFGPQSYTRGTGDPVTVTSNFTVTNSSASYTIRIHNGGLVDGEFEKVSSSIIGLNGIQIVGPHDFNQNVTLVEKVIAVASNNQLTVELRGKPGGGITIEIIGTDGQTSSAITITSPAPGSVHNASTILVSGNFNVTAGTEAGVKVNNVVAQASGGEFAAIVPLQPGTNIITAILGDSVGNTSTDSVTVEVPALQEEGLRLVASPANGLSPLTVELSVSSLLKRRIVSFDLDFEGDGVIDFASSTLNTISHTYSQTGLFFPTLTVTDDLGNRISATAIVSVFALPDLIAKWNALKDALRIGDVDGALRFIAEESKERYRGIFNTVGTQLSQVDSILTDLQFVAVRQNEAEFAMLRTSADGVVRSFYILFVRDNDGIWRLRVF